MYKHSVLSLAPVDFIKFCVSPVLKLPPGREPSEEAGTPLPGQESAEEEDAEEEEESSILKDSQKALEKSHGAQQLEGDDMVRLEPLGSGKEWLVENLTLKL